MGLVAIVSFAEDAKKVFCFRYPFKNLIIDGYKVEMRSPPSHNEQKIWSKLSEFALEYAQIGIKRFQ